MKIFCSSISSRAQQQDITENILTELINLHLKILNSYSRHFLFMSSPPRFKLPTFMINFFDIEPITLTVSQTLYLQYLLCMLLKNIIVNTSLYDDMEPKVVFKQKDLEKTGDKQQRNTLILYNQVTCRLVQINELPTSVYIHLSEPRRDIQQVEILEVIKANLFEYKQTTPNPQSPQCTVHFFAETENWRCITCQLTTTKNHHLSILT